jgi:hypothetical protein
LLARAARDDRQRLGNALQRIFEIAVIGGSWMAMTIALAAAPILAVIGGDEAQPAEPVLRILALMLLFVFVNTTWQHALIALRAHREMLIANLFALLALVALVFVLVPLQGAEGGAVAVVCGELLLVVASATLLVRGHPQLRPGFSVVPRVALAAAAAVAVALVVPGGDLVGAVLATPVYFGVLAALGRDPARGPHRGRRAAAAARGAARLLDAQLVVLGVRDGPVAGAAPVRGAQAAQDGARRKHRRAGGHHGGPVGAARRARDVQQLSRQALGRLDAADQRGRADAAPQGHALADRVA